MEIRFNLMFDITKFQNIYDMDSFSIASNKSQCPLYSNVNII